MWGSVFITWAYRIRRPWSLRKGTGVWDFKVFSVRCLVFEGVEGVEGFLVFEVFSVSLKVLSTGVWGSIGGVLKL